MPQDPDTGAPLPGGIVLPPSVVPPPPHNLQQAAERIQMDAEDLKSVVPWMEAQPGWTKEQALQLTYAHWNLTMAAYFLEEVLGLKYGVFFAAGSNKGPPGGGGG